jgi:hypothetical protein
MRARQLRRNSALKAASFAGLGGYAILGGVFFLISALRLHRAANAHSA